MIVSLAHEELVLALNTYLASKGLVGWYEPAKPFEPVLLQQAGKPVLERPVTWTGTRAARAT